MKRKDINKAIDRLDKLAKQLHQLSYDEDLTFDESNTAKQASRALYQAITLMELLV